MSRLAKERPIDLAKWHGPTRPYDLVKEFVIALTVVAVLALSLAALFSSPDEPALTLRSWAKAAPADFVATAAGELAGSTTSAGYGPPYNTAGEGQKLGPINLQKLAGVRIPIDSAKTFVVEPLTMLNDADTNVSLGKWQSASADQQIKWATAYSDALAKAKDATMLPDPTGEFGPVPTMVTALLGMAGSGALDGALTTRDTPLPTDFTKPLLFLADGGYFADRANAQHLSGDQSGMMNETGSYPGQSWLWLFTFWYQIEPFKSSGNADILIVALMGLLSLGFILIPVIPYVRRVPYWFPVHRLIWRRWYARRR